MVITLSHPEKEKKICISLESCMRLFYVVIYAIITHMVGKKCHDTLELWKQLHDTPWTFILTNLIHKLHTFAKLTPRVSLPLKT